MVFRTLFLVILYAVMILGLIPAILVCAVLGRRDELIAAGREAVRLSRFILGLDLSVDGVDIVGRVGAAVFMANHISFIDGPLLITVIPRPVRAILKKSIFRIPVLGLGMRYVGFIPVDRKGTQGGRAGIARAAALMHERGYSFLIFPEGTRSRDGVMGEFRRGGFFLALAAAAPIVPISIRGTFEIMPKGRWVPRKGRISVVFHDPIPTAGLRSEDLEGLMDRVRNAVAEESNGGRHA